MRVIGLDPSLTATGIAIIEGDDIHVITVKSKGEAGATLRDRHARLDNLRDRIMRHIQEADLVVIEQPAFSRTTGHHHDRSGLWWMIMDALHLWTCGPDQIAEVTPGSLKKYATGKGNAGKDEVLLAVARRYPDFAVKDNNQADALVLAAMGCRHLGHPIDDLPKLHLTAMDAVKWEIQP